MTQMPLFPEPGDSEHCARRAAFLPGDIRRALPSHRIIDTPSPSRARQLRMMTYEAYLKSPEWKLIRYRSAIWHDVSPEGRELHHEAYPLQRGCERYGDLEFKRPDAHAYVHGRAA